MNNKIYQILNFKGNTHTTLNSLGDYHNLNNNKKMFEMIERKLSPTTEHLDS